jgi:phosphatidylinositol N-acetylglucosaminyltransferase subunit A
MDDTKKYKSVAAEQDTGNEKSRRRLCICLVSDFFYPRLGGVELHQYSLAQCLLRRGHKVIVITGTYGDHNQRQGIRYLTNGLKVYYCPQMSIYNQASLPTLYSFFPLFRQIAIREGVDIVHGHQTTSSLAHECILHARTMGLCAVFTDHSLFGFANMASIHINKLMKFTLCDISHVITVSHCSKENLVLRAMLDPRRVSVIPNAVDSCKFTPNPRAAPDRSKRINIVILSRLVYRKGVDLVVKVVPRVCRRFPNVHFIIGGDGAKRLLVEEMREQHQLHDRVHLLGAVPHDEVRNVLVRGHIFLNCSLTEAFCIAILEAVSCGLFVVSTRVGGVPEILPPHMIRFAEPNVDELVDAVSDAIPAVRNLQPERLHEQVKEMYSWHSVAERTEIMYNNVIDTPDVSLLERLLRHYQCGAVAGKLFCLVIIIDHLFWLFLEWLCPRSKIESALDLSQVPLASSLLCFTRAPPPHGSQSNAATTTTGSPAVAHVSHSYSSNASSHSNHES